MYKNERKESIRMKSALDGSLYIPAFSGGIFIYHQSCMDV